MACITCWRFAGLDFKVPSRGEQGHFRLARGIPALPMVPPAVSEASMAMHPQHVRYSSGVPSAFGVFIVAHSKSHPYNPRGLKIGQSKMQPWPEQIGRRRLVRSTSAKVLS